MGSAAAWLWAVFPNAVIIPFEWVWDTSLSALLAATILLATLRLGGRAPLREWCGYGALWGLALMTNPALASVLGFLLGWLVLRDQRKCESDRPDSGEASSAGGKRLAGAGLALLVALLCCAPWTIRNYIVFHRFILLRSNFPFELWLGNNEVLDESSRDVMARVTTYGEVRSYVELGETAFMDEKWRLATGFLRSHPSQEPRLIGRRFIAIWTGSATPWRSFLVTDSVLVRVALLANTLVAAGALVGIIVLTGERNGFVFPLSVFPVIFPVVYYVTHASLRYRHPIDPMVLLLAVTAKCWAYRQVRSRFV